MPTEFELIDSYFANSPVNREDVVLGVGDDAAVVQVPEGYQLVAAVDTLVSGVHFFPDVQPDALGHKALAVNLSDFAAMGAVPAWATLALTLPEVDTAWIRRFSHGFEQLAQQYQVQLIGGDTTRGPLTISVQLLGYVPAGHAVRRSGARPGDLIFITGTLGDAGAALAVQQGMLDAGAELRGALSQRLNKPLPRVGAGLALREVAHAMIDISDGLAADLGHILGQSDVGARIDFDRLPVSESLAGLVSQLNDAAQQRGRMQIKDVDGTRPAPWPGYLDFCLAAGDDYELCFIAPADAEDRIISELRKLECPMSVVGEIEAAPGLRARLADGTVVTVQPGGYQHFGNDP
jgi:thiamine-monophosphate kinase